MNLNFRKIPQHRVWIAVLSAIAVLMPLKAALAHCPLCTIGAGAAAVLASSFGVGSGPIGVFVGAFAVALGLWIANMLKKEYIAGQRAWLVILSFITTVFPLMPLLSSYSSIYLAFLGDYGTTYPINLFLFGSIIGAIIVLISPYLSGKLKDLRKGKIIPFQGIAITFLSLFIFSVLIELWL